MISDSDMTNKWVGDQLKKLGMEHERQTQQFMRERNVPAEHCINATIIDKFDPMNIKLYTIDELIILKLKCGHKITFLPEVEKETLDRYKRQHCIECDAKPKKERLTPYPFLYVVICLTCFTAGFLMGAF
jgi:hypothetical protein